MSRITLLIGLFGNEWCLLKNIIMKLMGISLFVGVLLCCSCNRIVKTEKYKVIILNISYDGRIVIRDSIGVIRIVHGSKIPYSVLSTAVVNDTAYIRCYYLKSRITPADTSVIVDSIWLKK